MRLKQKNSELKEHKSTFINIDIHSYSQLRVEVVKIGVEADANLKAMTFNSFLLSQGNCFLASFFYMFAFADWDSEQFAQFQSYGLMYFRGSMRILDEVAK